MKKLFAVILTIALLIPMMASLASAEQPIEIRFVWWGDTKRHEVYNAVCDEFEAVNPGIKVIRESNTWTDYWDKLATQVAGGNAPDVMGMHPQFVSDYAGRGALANLEPFMDSGVIRTADIPEAVLEGGRVNGLMCMVSQGVTFTNLVANKTLLDEMGVGIPAMDGDWTWSEFAQKARDFRAAALEKGYDDVYFCDDPTGYNTARYLIRENGMDLYTEDGELGFTEEVMAQWFSYWKALRDDDIIPDAATTQEAISLTLEQKLFTVGKTAISNFPVNQLWLYQAQMPDAELAPLRMPTEEDGGRGEYIEGAHNAVSSASDAAHQEAGAKFIDFFVNDENALKHLKMEQGVPANTQMAEFIKPLLDEPNQKAINFVNATMEVTGVGSYAPIGASAVDAAYTKSRESVAFGAQTPEEAAAEFVAIAKDILAKNKG